MFATTQLTSMSFAYPDCCWTVVGTAVTLITYPNFGMSSVHVPVVYTYYMGAANVHNLLTTGTITSGDECGVSMGMLSGTIIGPDEYLYGSAKVFHGVSLAVHLTTITENNTLNAIGLLIVPSPSKTIILE